MFAALFHPKMLILAGAVIMHAVVTPPHRPPQTITVAVKDLHTCHLLAYEVVDAAPRAWWVTVRCTKRYET
jgi:hypothetical protein